MSTISSIDSISLVNQALGIQNKTQLQNQSIVANGHIIDLKRTSPLHFGADGSTGSLEPAASPSFEDAMLKALDGVNAMQLDSANAIETMMVNPEAIDPHDVTISMAKANMSLNITRTVLERIVGAWKNLVNMN